MDQISRTLHARYPRSPQTKAELMASIAREWSTLMGVVDRLTAQQMATPDAGGWTPSVHLAHLTAWQRYLVRHILSGEPPCGLCHRRSHLHGAGPGWRQRRSCSRATVGGRPATFWPTPKASTLRLCACSTPRRGRDRPPRRSCRSRARPYAESDIGNASTTTWNMPSLAAVGRCDRSAPALAFTQFRLRNGVRMQKALYVIFATA